MASSDKKPPSFSTKKCWECFTHLPLKAEVCHVCKKKVGKVLNNGMAEKPTDWMAYFYFIMSWVGLGYFIWKAFF